MLAYLLELAVLIAISDIDSFLLCEQRALSYDILRSITCVTTPLESNVSQVSIIFTHEGLCLPFIQLLIETCVLLFSDICVFGTCWHETAF